MTQDDPATSLPGWRTKTGGESEESPARIGRYRLDRLLGRGSFGDVWLAVEYGPLQRRVAVKRVRPNSRGAALDAALREARLVSRLDHPAIARVLDAGSSGDGGAYIALEYIEGLTLSEWCLRRAPELQTRLAVLEDVAEAMAYAHERAVIHRDLKPSNIVVRENEGERPRGVVLDFGVAALVDEGGERDASTLEPTVLVRRAGTLETMAPEQFVLGASPSTRADIYALGVLLYWTMTGRPPYARSSGADTEGFVNRVRTQPVPPIRERELAENLNVARSQIRDLNAVLARALAKDPGQRYAGAGEFAGELGRLRRGEPTDATAPGTLARSRRFVLRNKVPVAAASAVILTMGATTALVAEFAARERAARVEATDALARSQIMGNALRENLKAMLSDLGSLGNMPQTLAFQAQVLDAYERLEGRDSKQLAEQRVGYAEYLTKSERTTEAIGQLEEALRVALIHEDVALSAMIRLRLGFALEGAGRLAEALAAIDGAIADDLPRLDPEEVRNHPWFFHGLRGRLLCTLDREEEGFAALREAIAAQDRVIGGKGSLNDSQLRGVLISELIKADRIDEALAEGDALLADIERNGTAAASVGVVAWRERTRADLARLRLERASDADAPRIAAELRQVALEWRRLTGPSPDKFTAINGTLSKRGFTPITEEDALAFIEGARSKQGVAEP
jgi:tRNA A-37 threonylcarbamoyl transferase component Bud32/tetratricopeptide (TPR) repeat protein